MPNPNAGFHGNSVIMGKTLPLFYRLFLAHLSQRLVAEHHWVRGKAALGYGPDRIRTLVSMATESSHKGYNGENCVSTFSRLFFIRSGTTELAALEHLKN